MSLIACVAVVAHTLVDPAGWRRRQRVAADLAARAAARAALTARADALRAEVEALARSPAAQEHTVRDELGWVRPGDVLVHFGD